MTSVDFVSPSGEIVVKAHVPTAGFCANADEAKKTSANVARKARTAFNIDRLLGKKPELLHLSGEEFDNSFLGEVAVVAVGRLDERAVSALRRNHGRDVRIVLHGRRVEDVRGHE